jgi:2-haloacid dehalogenase
MKLSDFTVLTFDCYGTLIDWETGLFNALERLIGKSGQDLSRNAVLELFARHESVNKS